MNIKRSRWAYALGGTILGASLVGGTAFAASSGLGPTDWLDLRSPNGTINRVTVGDDGKLTAAPQVPTETPTTPPTTQPTSSAPVITYSGGWTKAGTDTYTSTVGATATIRFTGTALTVTGFKAAHHKNATVTVDGAARGSTTSVGDTRTEGTIYTVTGLTAGVHTVVLTAVGTVSITGATLGGTATTASPTSTVPTSSPTTTTAPASTGFVQQRGTSLFLDGNPYKFVGFNTVNMVGCSNSQRGITDYDAYYRDIGAGMTDRLWVLPGTNLATVDRIVAAAEKNRAKLNIVLFDGLGCIGPKFDQIAGGWDAQYKKHVADVVSRYKDSKTIAAWSVANEGGISNVNTYRLVSDYIRSIDGNHIVGTGTNAFYSDADIPKYRAILALPNISLGEIHEYDSRLTGVTYHLARALKAAAPDASSGYQGDPIYAGEVGIDANATGGGNGQTGGANGCVTFTQRGQLIKSKTDAYLNTDGVAGFGYWSIGKNDITGCDSYMAFSDQVGINAMKTAAAKWSTN